MKLSKNINLEMNAKDVGDIYRLKGNKESLRNPTIILEFCSSIMKTDLLKKTKDFNIKNKSKLQGKHLGLTTNEDTPIFISERLTAKGARLYFLARDLIRSNKVKYCWTSYGKIYVRKDESSKIILIQSEAQVHQMKQEI
ncbi:unnamed protein product [Euphydryas editha]|uniref:FP protein C-terminal domain-containing protein n=1 Tax=Euphydryas editha TaxID=104508 RepID=A0AAU9TE05_EUPED|nr:unnamed protein product [Euphydryas editha]